MVPAACGSGDTQVTNLAATATDVLKLIVQQCPITVQQVLAVGFHVQGSNGYLRDVKLLPLEWGTPAFSSVVYIRSPGHWNLEQRQSPWTLVDTYSDF